MESIVGCQPHSRFGESKGDVISKDLQSFPLSQEKIDEFLEAASCHLYCAHNCWYLPFPDNPPDMGYALWYHRNVMKIDAIPIVNITIMHITTLFYTWQEPYSCFDGNNNTLYSMSAVSCVANTRSIGFVIADWVAHIPILWVHVFLYLKYHDALNICKTGIRGLNRWLVFHVAVIFVYTVLTFADLFSADDDWTLWCIRKSIMPCFVFIFSSQLRAHAVCMTKSLKEFIYMSVVVFMVVTMMVTLGVSLATDTLLHKIWVERICLTKVRVPTPAALAASSMFIKLL